MYGPCGRALSDARRNANIISISLDISHVTLLCFPWLYHRCTATYWPYVQIDSLLMYCDRRWSGLQVRPEPTLDYDHATHGYMPPTLQPISLLASTI